MPERAFTKGPGSKAAPSTRAPARGQPHAPRKGEALPVVGPAWPVSPAFRALFAPLCRPGDPPPARLPLPSATPDLADGQGCMPHLLRKHPKP